MTWTAAESAAYHAAAAKWPIARCPLGRCEDCDAAETTLVGTVMCDPVMDWGWIRDTVRVIGPSVRVDTNTCEYEVLVREVDYEKFRADPRLRGRFVWTLELAKIAKPAKKRKRQ